MTLNNRTTKIERNGKKDIYNNNISDSNDNKRTTTTTTTTETMEERKRVSGAIARGEQKSR